MPTLLVYGAAANALADTSIGAAAGLQTLTSFQFGRPGASGYLLQIRNLGGTAVASTSGLKVQVFRRLGPANALKTDTLAALDLVLPTTVASSKPDGERRTLQLGPGDYEVVLENLDTTAAAANALTVSATLVPLEVHG